MSKRNVLILVISLMLFLSVLVLRYFMSHPLKEITIKEGNFGPYIIGSTKQEILSSFSDNSFSPQPKPVECPKNWIEVINMTNGQYKCLQLSDIWHVGYGNLRSYCKRDKVDTKVSLEFENNLLKMVTLECWLPK
jgi:topoisomerase IA-like protein